MPGCWEYAVVDGTVVAVSPALKLKVTPELGGTLTGLQWVKFPGLAAPAKVRAVVWCGRYYSRWHLNQLANPLFDTGEHLPLTAQVVGDVLIVRGSWQVHDLVLTRTIRAEADGAISLADHLSKTGPGHIKVQVVCEFHHPLADHAPGPKMFVRLPVGDAWETLWDLDASGNAMMDQDGHGVDRGRCLKRPLAEVGQAGNPARMVYELEDEFVCAALCTRPSQGALMLHLYGADVRLDRGGALECRYRLRPERPAGGEAPARVPSPAAPRRASLAAGAADLRADILANNKGAPATPEQTLQRELARWKLGEFDWYLANAEFSQAEGLLNDARAAWAACRNSPPARLPAPAALLYETRFDRLPADWQVFGLGRLRVDAELGLHVAPNTTMNLWTLMEFSGDYGVELDYQSTSDVPGSGTFLQLAAQSVNPRGELDFMVSATGNMPDYNFGVRCYHFSFNRHSPARQRQICNFRKTGQSFYVLAQVPEPLGASGRWYHLRMMRWRNVFRFWVDDRLVLYYADRGFQGPVYDQGRIGLRNWSRQESWFRNFKVYRLAPMA